MRKIDAVRKKLGAARPWRVLALAALTVVAVVGIASPSGLAQERRERWEGDIHRFHEHDFDRWRGGRWFHGRHEGRMGWWWIAGGSWYFYPAPIYPYPDPYQPPAVVLGPPPPPANYYYCDNPAGYYPYVPQCRTPWRVVPARP